MDLPNIFHITVKTSKGAHDYAGKTDHLAERSVRGAAGSPRLVLRTSGKSAPQTRMAVYGWTVVATSEAFAALRSMVQGRIHGGSGGANSSSRRDMKREVRIQRAGRREFLHPADVIYLRGYGERGQGGAHGSGNTQVEGRWERKRCPSACTVRTVQSQPWAKLYS